MARTKKSSEVTWKNEGSYPVHFIDQVFDVKNAQLADLLRQITGTDQVRVMLVADANVVQRTPELGTNIGKYIQAHHLTLAGTPLILSGGEKIKCDNMQSAQRVLSAALEAQIGVNDVMLVMGGGTVQDVAGYAAAQVRGGIHLVRMPTTIASMIDCTFADYAALDISNVKDALRLVSRPSAVVIDTTFTQTVLDGVWRGAFGEAIRFALISDGTLMRKIAKNALAYRERDAAIMNDIVQSCIESRLKKGSTNFALWSAFRMESMSGYKIPHGYSVPIGICIDCAYSVARGLMDQEVFDLVRKTLFDCGALEGLMHSRHLLQRPPELMCGLDTWRLMTGSEAIVVPTGIGSSTIETTPDRPLYEKVIKEFLLSF